MARPEGGKSRLRGALTLELLTLYSLIFADALSRSVVGVSLPLYLRGLGASAETYGALVAASRLLGMAIGVPAGVLADRLGGAIQMALGSVASGLGAAALGAASGLSAVAALYLASSAAGSAARVPTAPMLARLSGGRGLPFGVWGLLLSSAMALGTAGSALVASRLGLRWTFALAGVPLALAGLAALRLPEYGSDRPPGRASGFNFLSALADLRWVLEDPLRSLRGLLTSPLFDLILALSTAWGLGAAVAAGLLGEGRRESGYVLTALVALVGGLLQALLYVD